MSVTTAFVLGAGLGTRLRPLTDLLPKPLIPVHHKPLMVHAFSHLRSAGCVSFVVNTHHLPQAYEKAFPEGQWEGCPVTFRHEPVLLETGGGLANVADLLRAGPFLVYNGDVLTDLPLAPAMEAHRREGNLVTLLLRQDAQVRNVAFDAGSGRVLDLRNARNTNHPDQRGFTGIYVVEPDFFRYLIPVKIESVVAGFLRAIEAGEKVGGVPADEGIWLDLGDPASYLKAHRLGRSVPFPAYAPWTAAATAAIHPEALVHPGAIVDEASSVGPGAVVEFGAVLENTIVWPGACVPAGVRLSGEIVI
ncbi:MAG: Nucleotidyl transferase [Verrucomicrobiales bacterium]|nr:Nucleotidyl transferase [Verrucomicrobiales bacterium]